jgi:hypothetical protein
MPHTSTPPQLMADNAAHSDYETPVKAKVKGAIEYNRAKGIKGENEAVFRHFKVSYTEGYRML